MDTHEDRRQQTYRLGSNYSGAAGAYSAQTNWALKYESNLIPSTIGGMSRFLHLNYSSTLYRVQPIQPTIQPILLYGSETWHQLWEIGLPLLATFASDVFYGFRTQTMLPMLMYDSEPALHRCCCRSSKQDGSVSSGTWHG